MSTFVEVNSIAPKNCKVIVNLDNIIEIAPLIAGGCVLYFSAIEAGGPRTMTVSDDYKAFMQFAMQTVSADDIAKRFPKAKKEVNSIKPQEEGRGVEFNIPTLGG
jgi:tRNA A37 N6-isopentenylltransferase MiaA